MSLTSERAAVLSEVAARIERLPDVRPRRVAIDGITAAGKTTFADELASELRLRGTTVLRVSMDGFHNPKAIRYRQGRGSADGFYEDAYDFESVRRNLLDPLGPGGDRRYRTAVIDLATDEPVAPTPIEAPIDAVLLVDGSFLQKPALRDAWDHVVFLDASFEAAAARGVARDASQLGGTDMAAAAFRDRYHAAQRRYLSECDPVAAAGTVVRHDDPGRPMLVDPHPTSGSRAGRAGRIVVLAGPPGAGKTTVARLLTESTDHSSVCIETDWFWTTITNGFVEPWLPGADRQNHSVLRAAASAAAALATDGYEVVMEGVIGPWMLPTVSQPLRAAGLDVSYVVLRPDIEICLARAHARAAEVPRVEGHPPLDDSGPIRDLGAQMADLGPYEAHAVDTTDSDPTTTVAHLLDRLAQGDFRLG